MSYELTAKAWQFRLEKNKAYITESNMMQNEYYAIDEDTGKILDLKNLKLIDFLEAECITSSIDELCKKLCEFYRKEGCGKT